MDFLSPKHLPEPFRASARIRPATPVDAPSIARIHVETWRHAYRGIVPAAHLDCLSIERYTNGWTRNLQNSPGTVLVAEQSRQVVGWVSFGPSRDDGATTEAELYGLYVDPSHQRHGLGASLVRAAEQAIVERWPDAGRITLWVLERNEPARRFYTAQGYNAEGATKVETIGGTPLTELRYEKRLDVS